MTSKQFIRQKLIKKKRKRKVISLKYGENQTRLISLVYKNPFLAIYLLGS